MKKFLLLIGFAIASTTTFAQSISYGIKGGLNLSSLVVSAEGTNLTITSGNNTSFNAGLFADFKLSSFSIQPSLLFTGKGGKFTSNLQDDEGNDIQGGYAKTTLYYLQVPVDLLYHANVVAGDIFFGAGPYFAYGITGTSKADIGGGTISEDVKFGGDGDFKKTDAGINFTAGIKLKGGLLFNVNYDLGLTNISNDPGPGRLKTRVFGLSAGYAF